MSSSTAAAQGTRRKPTPGSPLIKVSEVASAAKKVCADHPTKFATLQRG
jgi:hypothetical protein